MKLYVLIPGIYLSSVIFLHAQQQGILALGKVIDSKTHKGLKARIHYSSIPTGSIHGDFNDSTFSFEIFGTARYKVTAEAQGYIPKTVIVDPKNIGTDNKLQQDIALMPRGETIRLNHLIFPQGTASISPESFDELNEVVDMMKSNSKMVIQLEGHTDNVGSAEANLALSTERVGAVKKYMTSKGIAKNRVKTKAFGGTKPLSNEMTPEARALNRRVEMRILKD